MTDGRTRKAPGAPEEDGQPQQKAPKPRITAKTRPKPVTVPGSKTDVGRLRPGGETPAVVETMKPDGGPWWFHWAYGFTTLAIVAASIIFVLMALGDEAPVSRELPVEFRTPTQRLSGLEVGVSNLRSCSCWDGPRDQAERKFKFKLVNHGSRYLNVGGGPKSAVRLIVAYPRPERPLLTVPVRSKGDVSLLLGSPDDRETRIAQKHVALRASRWADSNQLLSVPANYTVWAIPPNANGLAEPKTDGLFTYPTEVDKPRLLPHSSYSDTRLGHGTWTFYIPLDPPFWRKFSGEMGDQILPREEYEPHVIIVGIAVFAVNDDDVVDPIGFAPAPSDDQLSSPDSL